MYRAVAAAFLFFGLLTSSYAQRGGGMRSSGGGGMRGMSAARPSMGFRAAPPRTFARVSPSPFVARQAALGPRFSSVSRSGFVRPRSTVIRSVPQRHGVVTFGHSNGGSFFTTSRFHNGHFNDHFRHDHFRHSAFFAFPFYYSGAYWDPYYDQYWNPYYSMGPYAYDPNSGTSTYTDLSNQLGNLSAQVEDLREENDALRSDLEQSQQPPAPPPSSSSIASGPPTILAFNDGHQTEVQNYAIVGQTLWMLSAARATKVPLADLNLNQTIKLNEARGVEFLGPASKQ